MSPEEFGIIKKVCKKFRKYKFGSYSSDDIEQEAFLMCMDALQRYNGTAPLENFLSNHVKNRLLLLKRKEGINYSGTTQYSEIKYNMLYPLPIDGINDEDESNLRENRNILEEIASREILDYIDQHLPATLRMDYLKFIGGVKLTKTRRDRIKQELLKILSNYEK